MPDGEIRLMVKGAALTSRFALGSGRGALRGRAEPLFSSIGDQGLGAAPGGEAWQLLRFAEDEAPSPWDLCHAILRGGSGFAAVPGVQFAEPDLEQRWSFAEEAVTALRLAEACPPTGAPQSPRFPQGPQPGPHAMWHAGPDHGQFEQIDALFDAEHGPRVRIAQLDTGFDPNHQTLPARLRHDLQRNFVGGEPANDASDGAGGFLNKAPGHGTGTLGILAGRTTGAAPWAEVIPLRVANGVVLFRNSAIARALDHVHALCADPQTFVHVVTMSMGGLASRAWAEAVNVLYELGVTMVSAAGNNYGNLPTRFMVYPARFNRVVAASGVMADFAPYTDLGLSRMAGNYGPPAAMRTAVAASTPNMPWPRMGCAGIVDSDGAGTSAATPQVAAAAALWIARHHDAWAAYPEDWMRVEAVRHALFSTAVPGRDAEERARLGYGRLRAAAALLVGQPVAAAELTREAPDSARFAAFRMLLGLGMQGLDPGLAEMLELEALQLSQSAEIEALLPDGPDVAPDNPTDLARLREALADAPGASQALKSALGHGAERPGGPAARLSLPGEDAIRRRQLEHALDPPLDPPPRRRLKVFAFDPVLGTDLATLRLNQAVLSIPWEALEPGPVGRYLEIVDIDPPSRLAYAPVDLDAPALLACDGLAPTESDPRFHQQMVYAVAMRTIAAFEEALGRAALWAPRITRDSSGRERVAFVEKLRIYPHALREANAYYSPDRQALLFGYFEGTDRRAGELVFTCLSHDIIAHEVTHALLDGLHRRMRVPTNPDVLAFHEAFADAVALFQHFSLPEALKSEIARTRGDLGQEGLLGALAQQFGQALGGHGALRDFLGAYDAEGVWHARTPRPDDYETTRRKGPHALGAVLVAAIFDAFLQIYRRRAAAALRLATGGTGVLPPGALPSDLVDRLASEASTAASHVLQMVIRALDYCPPVDITFGEYLRALVTGDRDMVPNDGLHYRVAFVAAFRARGIRPEGVRHVSADALLWDAPPVQPEGLEDLLGKLSLGWTRGGDRAGIARICEENAGKVQQWLDRRADDAVLASFGLVRTGRQGEPWELDGLAGRLLPLAVQSVRPCRRIGPDGDTRRDLVVEVTQDWQPDSQPTVRYSGGATLLIDMESRKVRYAVRKRVANPRRVRAQMAFAGQTPAGESVDAAFGIRRGVEPFAMLHAGRDAWEAADGET
ncbi:S8 family serine peptidase [Pararhodobacter sp. SW119]|uniref:S8 family serine peptidase n=1 Tax=Pararhodobacter sp. SW119 TaxID=2780075 RepID=UPI001ADFCEF1|nr:S8 family serine peptidase [Pararhodobacter sp. SW119]